MKRGYLLWLAATAVLLTLAACEADTGPDAPARTNGCIDTTCAPAPTPVPDAGQDAG